MEKTNEDIEIDLMELFYLIRARLWILVLTGILTAVAAGLISNFMLTPMYTSRAQLFVLSKSSNSVKDLASNLTNLTDLQLGSQLTQDYMVLVKSRPVVEQVNENLELNMTYEQLVSVISITNPTNTRILTLSVTYQDKILAKRIVDEFTNVSKSRIASIMNTEEPTVVEYGVVPSEPSSPNTKRNVIIGALVGVFLAAAVIIVLHLMDDTIKDAEDIEKYLDISTLGLIPIESGAAKQTELDKKRRRKRIVRAGKGKR